MPGNHNVFAAGDFNTTAAEDAAKSMLERFVRPGWQVAHDACSDCPGTQYYARDDAWSFLDMIVYAPSRSEKTTWQIRADSVRIANHYEGQVQEPGIPLRYNATERVGVSDHWPLLISIETTTKQ